ncbi:MAG: Acylamidase, partial [Pseudomonadota bacterium]
MSALHLLPAHQLIALYRDGSLSPVDVAQALIARIDQLNPTLNAFCLFDAERAL